MNPGRTVKNNIIQLPRCGLALFCRRFLAGAVLGGLLLSCACSPQTGMDAEVAHTTSASPTDTVTENSSLPTAEVFVFTQEATPVPVPETIPSPAPAETASVPSTGETAVSVAESHATLQFVGDLMCLKAQQKIAKTKSGFNFNPSFSRIKSILTNADLTVGNLETVTDDTIPYTLDVKSEDGSTPYCNAPSSYLDAVQEAGFGALITANNHCCDCGEDGIWATIDALDRRNIPHTGTFRGEEDRFLLFELNGITVAILGNTATVNGNEKALSAEKQSVMLNLYTAGTVKRDIIAARAAGAEFVIVYMHGGTENSHSVTSRQISRAQELADAGADLIIGSHPHVLQKAVTLTSADGREVPCFYSLGNFLSSMNNDENRDAAIVRVELVKIGNTVSIADIGYIGVLTVLEHDKLIVTPVSSALNGGIKSEDLTAAQERIRKRLGNAVKEITE